MRKFNSQKFFYRLRRYFISGLLIWVPIWITFIVFTFIIDILDRTLFLLPPRFQFAGLGVLLTLLIIILTGLLATNYLGSRLIDLWDQLIDHIPFVRTVYNGVRDVMNTLLKPEGSGFVKVYLVEFPRAGMWTVAFQTGDGSDEISAALNKRKLISLFIPTTPNITSGFLVMVFKEEAIELNMTIEQALKFVISLGVVQPDLTANNKKGATAKKNHTTK